MNKVSILLGPDGSEASARAGQFALWLAARANARIEAIHIIDSTLIDQLVQYNRPGIIGSGPFLAARETITEAMQKVGEALTEKFQALADGNAIEASTAVCLGNPSEVLLKLSSQHAFVVTGSTFRSGNKPGSLALNLADRIKTPYIVVSPEWQIPTRLSWLTTEQNNYDSYLQYGMLLADTFGAEFDLEVAAQNLNKPQLLSLRDRAVALVPAQNEASVKVVNIEGNILTADEENRSLTIRSTSSTMTVLPVRSDGADNRTILGCAPSMVLNHIEGGAAIFYPICKETGEALRCA